MKRANRTLVSGALVASLFAGSLIFSIDSADAAQRRNRRNRNSQGSRVLKDLVTSAGLYYGSQYLSRHGGKLGPVIGAIAGSGLLGGGGGGLLGGGGGLLGGGGGYSPFGGGGYAVDPYGSNYRNNR